MLSSESSIFDTLPTRPPTPPKDVNEHVESALHFLENGYDENSPRKLERQRSTDTPPQSSPIASQEAPGASNGSKKVGFSPFPPVCHDIPKFGVSSSPRDRLLRARPRTQVTGPLKSILKASAAAPPLTPDDQEPRRSYFAPDDPNSFGKMLQSVMQELASTSRSLRLDAYLVLNGALRTYEGRFPDRESMIARMASIQQFLVRDIVSKDSQGVIDTQIATQALKLTAAMLGDSQITGALDDDFRSFILDRSIVVMEKPDMPKPIVKLHLYLVAQQRFSPTIMSHSRADRIVSALRTIEDRCSGNTLIATRLTIYQRLLEQSHVVMLHRLPDWLEHVFHGMLSSLKDTRLRAIEVGTQAGLTLGTNPVATKAIHDLFETEVEGSTEEGEPKSYSDYLSVRLINMIKDKELGPCVPQIWAVVILFFRSKRRPLDRWPRFKSWLIVLQKCLNAGDLGIKYQATLAWKKLAFTVMPDASTSANNLALLKIPISAGFEKYSADRTAKQLRQFTVDNYINLLHYALRPALSHAELDTAWDAYVEPLLLPMIKASSKARITGSKVLHGLLGGSTGGWNEYAALEAEAIKPEELHRLEPRWVRSRMARVLKLIEPIVTAELATRPEHSVASSPVWKDMLQSVSEAGAQEIRTANELREAVAHMLNTLQRMWQHCCSRESQSVRHTTSAYMKLLSSTCEYLSPGLLTEELLSRNAQGDAQAAPTPSHRPSKHQNALHSPLVFVLNMLCSQEKGFDRTEWHDMASAILTLACSNKTTSMAKVQLLRKTSQHLYTSSGSNELSRQLVDQLWPLFALEANGALQPSQNETELAGRLGEKYRDVLHIIISGLPRLSTSAETTASGVKLTEALVDTARDKAGDAGAVIAVVEPLAKALLDRDAGIDLDVQITMSTAFMGSVSWPQNRQAVDQARKVLWGIGAGPQRAGPFDPFEHVYGLIRDILKRAYRSAKDDFSAIIAFSSTLSDFLRRCPTHLLAGCIRQIQEGLISWVEDKDRKVFIMQRQEIAEGVVSLWSQILEQLNGLPRKDNILLNSLQSLFVAGLMSPKRRIVNNTIGFWNAGFGEQERLIYPAKIEKVLRVLRQHVDLSLPGFLEQSSEDQQITLPAFAESQEETDNASSGKWSGLPQGTASTAKPAQSSKGSSHLHTIETTISGVTETSSSSRPTPKARLRHDDSQIQFAPIESSPAQAVQDSQLLTDRQKEVKARQAVDAQMFPDLSSSPVAKPAAAPLQLPRMLNFGDKAAKPNDGDEAVDTPDELPEANNDTSDYMGSSPTPRSSAKGAFMIAPEADGADDEDEETGLQIPSSSPPRPQDDIGKQTDGIVPSEEDEEEGAAEPSPKPKRMQINSDLPSDTVLPAQQLQREAEDANNNEGMEKEEKGRGVGSQPVDSTTVVEPSVPSSPQTAIHVPKSGANVSGEEPEADISRIENSFVEPETEAADEAEASQISTASSTRSTRKRKRGSAAGGSSTKKRKQQSPFRRILSGIFGGGQAQEDEDIEDEIVVASSQPGYSPQNKKQSPTAEAESQEQQNVPQNSTSAKRRPGRPRKSETPTPPPPAAVDPIHPDARRSKRKASSSSLRETAQEQPEVIQDTPAPNSRPRKQRKGKDKNPIASPEQASRREAVAVVIEPTGTPTSISRTREEDVDEEGEATPVKPERPIATPKSIIGRLRDMLGECKKLVLGSQEYQEMDDVLFEMNKEMREAARRGREQ